MSGSPDSTQSTMAIQTRSDSMIDLHKIQKDLEELWTDLKMPLDQKIDMAIKYSSPNIGNRAEPVNFQTLNEIGSGFMERSRSNHIRKRRIAERH